MRDNFIDSILISTLQRMAEDEYISSNSKRLRKAKTKLRKPK